MVVFTPLFWNAPETVRYGVGENLYGYAAIKAFRAARPAHGLDREITARRITSFGRDFAAAAPRFQQAVAVAGFAEQLRGSGMGAPSLDGVLAITQRIAPQLANDNDVQEFAQLVARAIELQS